MQEEIKWIKEVYEVDWDQAVFLYFYFKIRRFFSSQRSDTNTTSL